jgi:hypothetical protein
VKTRGFKQFRPPFPLGKGWSERAGHVIVALIGAAVVVGAARGESLPQVASSETAAPAPPRRASVGVTMSLHHTERLAGYLDAVNLLASMGFDSLQVITPVYQRDAADDQIRVRTEPGGSPHRDQLVNLLWHARARGMRTMLMPIVLLSDPQEDEWRGKIQPMDWDRWWQSYRATIDHFVQVAVESRADVFCVGSELLSTESQTERWIELIGHVRRKFSGVLTYSTNWDHFQVPQFWPQLDVIGMTGYFDLTSAARDPQNPRFDELCERWRQIRSEVLALAQRFNRPLLFAEIGYPSLPWALKDPWNYVNDKNAASEPGKQAFGYRSFLTVWDDLLVGDAGRFCGVYFFRWDPFENGGPNDTGYGIQGKMSEGLIRAFLKRRRTMRGGGVRVHTHCPPQPPAPPGGTPGY